MNFANGPGFAGLYAGDVVEFASEDYASRGKGHCVPKLKRAAVLPLLVFADHVQVNYTSHGYTVDASNFVRLVRRGKRHIAADRQAANRTMARTGDAYLQSVLRADMVRRGK